MNFLRRINFQLWYFRKPPWDSGISPPELYDFIQKHKPGRAIDLGCGTGTNVITLARAGWQVTGIDFAARAIQIAKRKTKDANVSADLLVGDVTSFRADSKFELALDIGCFHGVKDKTAYLGQLNHVLAQRGSWLMYGFFKSTPHLAGPGLVEADIEMILSHDLTLISRRDGFDKQERPSAWFLFQKE